MSVLCSIPRVLQKWPLPLLIFEWSGGKKSQMQSLGLGDLPLIGYKKIYFGFFQSIGTAKARPMDLIGMKILQQKFQKSCHRDNWLMAAKRSQRRRFFISRCRLFLSLRSKIRLASDSSPANRERGLGLDRRETS